MIKYWHIVCLSGSEIKDGYISLMPNHILTNFGPIKTLLDILMSKLEKDW